MKLIYPACFYSHNDDEGYTVVIPDLPGCVTEGSNMDNAIDMAIDAASGWVLDELEDGNLPPKSTPINNVELENFNGTICLIPLDMDSYSEKYGNKAVRKNLTIPAWLNKQAEKAHVNFSSILQDALKQQLHLE